MKRLNDIFKVFLLLSLTSFFVNCTIEDIDDVKSALPYLVIETDSVSFDNVNTYIEIPIKTNRELTIETSYIDSSGVDPWLWVGISEKGDILKISAQELKINGTRSALVTISITNDLVVDEITVHQADSILVGADIEQVHLYKFLAAYPNPNKWYKLRGMITNLQDTKYGFFNLQDRTGIVFVNGLNPHRSLDYEGKFSELNLKEGDIVTLVGTRGQYDGTPIVEGPAYYVTHETTLELSVADFIAQSSGTLPWYKLTGKVSNIVDHTRGSFDLVDATGSVCVESLTSTWSASCDDSFKDLGINEGDIVTLVGQRYEDQWGTVFIGGPACYISHTDEQTDWEPIEGEYDLSQNGRANCYLISQPGEYGFDASFKGNSTEWVGDVASVEVLWETAGTVKTTEGSIISNVQFKDGYVKFVANPVEGNALIAVKDASGTILWSWHIWITDQPENHYYINGASGYYVMDRNLGAIRPNSGINNQWKESVGTHYQRGRKDPFIMGAYTLASSPYTTVEQSVANPTEFSAKKSHSWLEPWDYLLWSPTNKTMYDPCPVGYRVATKDVYACLKSPKVATHGVKFCYDGYNTAWYPGTPHTDCYGNYMNDDGHYAYMWVSNATSSRYEVDAIYYDSYAGSSGNIVNSTRSNGDSYPVRCMKDDGSSIPPAPEPDPELSDCYLIGDFNAWGLNEEDRMRDEGEFYVYRNLTLDTDGWICIVRGIWEETVGHDGEFYSNTAMDVRSGVSGIAVPAGTYDVYLSSDLSKLYFMTDGKTPDQAAPAPVETTYTVTGTIQDAVWDNSAAVGLMTKKGDYYVAKNIPFIWAKSTTYGGDDELIKFQISVTGRSDKWWGVSRPSTLPANAEISVSLNTSNNIYVKAPEGNYDVYFNLEDEKVWLMEPGKRPGDDITSEKPGGTEGLPDEGYEWE